MKVLDSIIQVDTVKINREVINSLPKVFGLYIQEFVNSEIILKDKRRNPSKYFVSEVSCVLYDNDFIRDLFTISRVIRYKGKGMNQTVLNIDFKGK